MQVLLIRNVTKSFGDRLVLSQASLALNYGERVALVGANGSGKTSLLTIAAGLLEPDAGEIRLDPLAEVGYLPQTFAWAADLTVAQLIAHAQTGLVDLESRMHALAEQMATATGDDLSRLTAEHGAVAARFEQRGGYDLPYRTRQVLQGLGLGRLDPDRHTGELSGGEKRRAGLAALLIGQPDLLLLDEPTNDLDAAALTWLEGYLARYRGALLVVSHDRTFLDRVVRRYAEVPEQSGELKEYRGTYADYLAEKARERQRWAVQYHQQQAEIRYWQERREKRGRQVAHNRPPRDGDKLAHNFFGERVQRTVARNVRQAEEALARIEQERIAPPPEPLRFQPRFAPVPLDGTGALLEARDLHKAHASTLVLGGVSLSVGLADRILIEGPNGAGKTTLLNLLAGLEAPDSGLVVTSEGATVGYLRQEAKPEAPEATVLDAFRRGLTGYADDLEAQFLAYGLFRPEELAQPANGLSPGQQRKLQLARLMASGANLLLLDEPTNHISFDVLEDLEQALAAFPGPVVAVSHDRRFCSCLPWRICRLENGVLHEVIR